MLKRDDPREVPSLPHYLDIEAGGRTWTFRIPPERKQIAMVRFVGSMSEGEDVDPVERTSRQAAAMGTLIGRCWFDRERDLEAVENGDALAFGEAVNDELYEDGFPLHVSVTLGAVIMKACASTMIGADRVNDLLGFTPPPPSAGSGGSDSTSP